MTYNPVGEPGQPHPSDTFSVTLRSVWGDTWEWPAVRLDDACAIHRQLRDAPVIFTNVTDDQADSEL